MEHSLRPSLSSLRINFFKAVLYWTATAVYAFYIFHLSSLTNPMAEIPCGMNIAAIEGSGFDKVLHFLEYAGFGFLLYKAIRATFGRVPVLKIAIVVFIAAGLYAISDEFHQSFVPGRDACFADAFADHVGILVGVGASLL